MPVVTLTNSLIRAVCEEHGFGRPKDGILHVVGIRNAQPHGDTAITVGGTPRLDKWDDTVGCFGAALEVYTATTDPSRYWTVHPENPLGAAWLIPGKYNYRVGYHKTKTNPALVQNGPVAVRRDRDRDGRPEYGEPTDVGWFGIHIHRGGRGSLPVGRWSAGCQVIVAEDWPVFWDHIEASGQQEFQYWLLLAQWFAG